jgi:Asp-tRNA(Asn)/Glu-tRNA(Gln) amidotransferase A subunit family amidase
MKSSIPPADAFTVQRMRQAGALILAKGNLQEFARGGMSVSSLGGQVHNPYDLRRTPGGSSGGPAAAVAANFAVLATGSDTGQSIRSPAAANNLVGIRPTRGLVSRSGVIPNSLTQDEIGPITRTVTDAALLLDVMAGYDPADPVTAFSNGRMPRSYAQLLNRDALKGARIGVMTNLFGTAERHREVNKVMDGVIAGMQQLGATLVRFELPEYDKLSPVVSTSLFEARSVMESYFATLGPNAPIKSFAALVAAKTSAVQKTLEAEIAVEDGMNNQKYKDQMLNRDKLRLAVAKGTATRPPPRSTPRSISLRFVKSRTSIGRGWHDVVRSNRAIHRLAAGPWRKVHNWGEHPAPLPRICQRRCRLRRGHRGADPRLSGGQGATDQEPREQVLRPRWLLAPCDQSRPCGLLAAAGQRTEIACPGPAVHLFARRTATAL